MVDDKVLKERQQLAGDGIVTVAASVNWDGRLFAKPDIHLRGVVTSVNPAQLQTRIQQALETVLSDRWKEFARTDDRKIEVDWAGLEVQLEREIHRLLRRELQSNPLLVFLLQAPEEQPVMRATRTRSSAKVAS
jgi:ribonuclease J